MAGLLVRAAVVSDRTGVLVAAGVVALLGLLVLGELSTRRTRSTRRTAEEGGPATDRVGAQLVTGVVVLTACAALVTELQLH